MPYNYAVRITRAYADLSGALSCWVDRCERFMVVEHPPGRKDNTTHVHLALGNSDIQIEQLKKELRKVYDCGAGNKFWSFKVWDGVSLRDGRPRAYPQYMIKGQYTPFIHKGWSPEEINAIRAAWDDDPIAEEYKAKQAKQEKQDKEKTTRTHWELIEEIYKKGEHSPRLIQRDGEMFSENYFMNSRHNFDIMRKVLNENKVRTSRNELERFWITLMRFDYSNGDDLYHSINGYMNRR